MKCRHSDNRCTVHKSEIGLLCICLEHSVESKIGVQLESSANNSQSIENSDGKVIALISVGILFKNIWYKLEAGKKISTCNCL